MGAALPGVSGIEMLAVVLLVLPFVVGGVLYVRVRRRVMAGLAG